MTARWRAFEALFAGWLYYGGRQLKEHKMAYKSYSTIHFYSSMVGYFFGNQSFIKLIGVFFPDSAPEIFSQVMQTCVQRKLSCKVTGRVAEFDGNT